MSNSKFGITISGNEIFSNAVPHIFYQFNKLQIPIYSYVTVIPFLNKAVSSYIDSDNYLIYTNHFNSNYKFIKFGSPLIYDKKFIKQCDSHHNIREMSLLLGLNMLGCERSLSIIIDKNTSSPFPVWRRFNSHLASFRIVLSDKKNIKSQIETYFESYKYELYNFFFFSFN